MKSKSEARPSTVFLFYYTSIFTILQPPGSGCHEIKVNKLPDWDWAWSDGTKAAKWGSLKGYLCECFYLSSYIQHVSTSKRVVDLIFVITVEWISPVKHRVQNRATNEECFSSDIWEIAVSLYNWLVSPWELPDKTGTWKVKQKTTVARPSWS